MKEIVARRREKPHGRDAIEQAKLAVAPFNRCIEAWQKKVIQLRARANSSRSDPTAVRVTLLEVSAGVAAERRTFDAMVTQLPNRVATTSRVQDTRRAVQALIGILKEVDRSVPFAWPFVRIDGADATDRRFPI